MSLQLSKFPPLWSEASEKMYMCLTHVSDERRVGVGRPDVVVHVELLVHLQVHLGVQVRVAAVAATAALVVPGRQRYARWIQETQMKLNFYVVEKLKCRNTGRRGRPSSCLPGEDCDEVDRDFSSGVPAREAADRGLSEASCDVEVGMWPPAPLHGQGTSVYYFS